MWPLVVASADPKSPADAVKLHAALVELAVEDATFSFDTSEVTARAIMYGMSEAHLDRYVDVLRRTYNVDADFGPKQVAYYETLGRKAEVKYTHKRQIGGSGQYAEVTIVFEPLERKAGIVFENKVIGGTVPQNYIQAVEKGVRLQAKTGLLAGFPTMDFKFTLVEGKYHDLDSSALAFEVAAKACFRELRKAGSPKVLEPVMKIEVLTPPTYVRDIIDDLKSRRGQIQKTEVSGDSELVSATAPLAEMFRYTEILRCLSVGLAQFTMHYERHEEAPLSEPPDDRFPSAMAMRA
jgi:elongation factor G